MYSNHFPNNLSSIIMVLLIGGLLGMLSTTPVYLLFLVFLIVIPFLVLVTIQKRNVTFYILIFFLSFPFFLSFGGPSLIGLGYSIWSKGQGQTLPISILFIGFIITLIVIKGAYKKNKFKVELYGKLIIIFSFLNLLLGFIGIYSSNSISNLQLVFQTIIPVLPYFLSFEYIKRYSDFERIINIIIIGGFSGALLLTLSNIIDYGFMITLNNTSYSDKIFFFYVYQIFDYYPLVLAITICFVIAKVFISHWKYKLIWIIIILPMIITLLNVNARNSLLTVIIFTLLFILIAPLHKIIKVLVPTLFLGVLTVSYKFLDLPVFNRTARGYDASIDERVNRIESALYSIYENPFAGTMFNIETRILAHNQYLEIASNSGLFMMVFFIIIIIGILLKTFKSYIRLNNKKDYYLLLTTICIIISVMLGSNIAQSNFTQPYSSFILWFLLGSCINVSSVLNKITTKKDINSKTKAKEIV